MSPVSIVERAAAGTSLTGSPAAAHLGSGGVSFADTLGKAVDAVNTLQWQAQDQSRALATGQAANLHDVTIALEQASISLQLATTVRNKVIDAYQEIMRMQM
jgi:flagellar hook-basal body complex protein FliE